MTRLASANELAEVRERMLAGGNGSRPTISVCGGTGCRVYGSEQVWGAFRQELEAQGANLLLEYDIKVTGCHGFCEKGPLVVIRPQGFLYTHVRVQDVPEIVRETILGGRVVERLLYHDPQTGAPIEQEEEVPFYKNQLRLILNLNGQIDPFQIDEYIAAGGYAALARVLAEMTPEQVIAEVRAAGLRGRGGAGFSTATKWELCRRNVLATGSGYIVCNADEGDSGTFSDRMLMEGDPLCLIEGMTIAGIAVGATQGYVYLRSEYPHAQRALNAAIANARAAGWLGADIGGSGKHFDVEVRLGAGAYICGEETSLLDSLEGKRGQVRFKPPLPAIKGLFGQPTVVNNVISFASVPIILDKGAEFYRDYGVGRSRGTLPIQLAGNLKRTGLVEKAFGVSLRELLYDWGGGSHSGRPIRAVQVGGPLGAYLPESQFDTPLDYEAFAGIGAMLGHGGIVAFDDTVDMLEQARYAMEFCAIESCGKCTPCRIGSTRGVEIIERVRAGRDAGAKVERDRNLALLDDLCHTMRHGSLCALGGLTPDPVLSALKHFPEDFS